MCFLHEEDLVASSTVDTQGWNRTVRTKIRDDLDGDSEPMPTLDYWGVFKKKTSTKGRMHDA